MGIDEIATIFRGLERIIIISTAILALYFGYKLFLAGIDSGQSGEFTSQKFTIKLIKVGPGIFFALFSTIVLIFMTRENIKFNGHGNNNIHVNQIPGSRLKSFFGTEDSNQLKRQLEIVSHMKKGFQSGEISKEVFLSSIGPLQKASAKIYVGNEIYEKCEFDSKYSETQDCQTYFELIK